MKFTSKEILNSFIADVKSKNYTNDQLVKKYNFNGIQDFYQTTGNLRRRGKLPKTKLSEAISKYWAKKKEGKTTETKSVKKDRTNISIAEYRTVYFKDFSVQIHKKAMARLVVDQNNNLHILNG